MRSECTECRDRRRLTSGVYILKKCVRKQVVPYNNDSTASRLLSEVKHCLARLVLRWGTTLESREYYFFLRFRNKQTKRKESETCMSICVYIVFLFFLVVYFFVTLYSMCLSIYLLLPRKLKTQGKIILTQSARQHKKVSKITLGTRQIQNKMFR